MKHNEEFLVNKHSRVIDRAMIFKLLKDKIYYNIAKSENYNVVSPIINFILKWEAVKSVFDANSYYCWSIMDFNSLVEYYFFSSSNKISDIHIKLCVGRCKDYNDDGILLMKIHDFYRFSEEIIAPLAPLSIEIIDEQKSSYRVSQISVSDDLSVHCINFNYHKKKRKVINEQYHIHHQSYGRFFLCVEKRNSKVVRYNEHIKFDDDDFFLRDNTNIRLLLQTK